MIVHELLTAETLPDVLYDVEIKAEWDEATQTQTAEFFCYLSGQKELYVKIALGEESYDILNWQIRDTEEWVPDRNIAVWFSN
jgi:hypothetical protein